MTYTLDRKASWSDGTPITAEDFSYLRDQLLVQPGTVNSGRLSADQRRSARGTPARLVEVEFSEPFPDWPTLFSPLLPSHLMKDFPGWLGSGARRRSSAVRQPLQDELLRPGHRADLAGPQRQVLGDAAAAGGGRSCGWATRRICSPRTPGATCRRCGSRRRARWPPRCRMRCRPTCARWCRLPPRCSWSSTRLSVPRPALLFATAIAAGITSSDVAADLTGGWSDGGNQVTSQVALPAVLDPATGGSWGTDCATDRSTDSTGTSAAGDGGTSSPVSTGEQVARDELAAAGYLRNGLYVSRDGEILRLTLGYPSGDPRLAAAARTIQRQLGLIGIEIDLLPDAAPNLVETRIASGAIDLALLAVPRGMSNAVSAASAFGCPTDSVLGIGSTVTTEATPTEATPTPGHRRPMRPPRTMGHLTAPPPTPPVRRRRTPPQPRRRTVTAIPLRPCGPAICPATARRRPNVC